MKQEDEEECEQEGFWEEGWQTERNYRKKGGDQDVFPVERLALVCSEPCFVF